MKGANESCEACFSTTAADSRRQLLQRTSILTASRLRALSACSSWPTASARCCRSSSTLR